MFGILEKIDSQYLQQASDTLMHYTALIESLRKFGCKEGQYPFLIFPARQTSTSDSSHVRLLLQFRGESLPLPLLFAADARTARFTITTIRGTLSIPNKNEC